MSKFIWAWFSVLMLCMPSSIRAQSDASTRLGNDTEAPPQRLALLIGNSNYTSLNPLKNPKNDVDQLSARLKQLGFVTTVKYDLDHDNFVTALAEFGTKIEPGGIALFYYSGHGVQLAGTNYLIPVNMQSAANAVAVQGTGISLSLVRNALGSSRLSLIILDACRTLLHFSVKGPTEGLAAFFSRGALVAYAADEGQAASDNDTENVSLFTKHLIKELEKRDETLCDLFGGVRQAVDVASGHVQFPFIYDGVIGDFVFNRNTTGESRKLAAASDKIGRTKLWTTIQDSDNPNDFAAFLLPRFSDKGHVKVAEARLSSLMSSTAKATGVVPLVGEERPEVVALANQGERLFYEKAYTEAVKTYEKLFALSPSDVSVIYDLATCLLYSGKHDEAIGLLSKALSVNSDFPWAYFNRGVAYHLKGDAKKAIDDYTIALQHRPGYAVGYNNLALAKRDTGDLTGAEVDAQKAIALDPFYAPAFFNRAKIAAGLGNGTAAVGYVAKGKDLTIPES
jgi:tetratricopeptide (TPR) repeat protein